MKVREVLSEMTTQDASEIFAKFGVPDAIGLPKDTLKAERNRLIMQHHQDFTGDPRASQEINAAYDLLSRKPAVDRHVGGADPYWHPNAGKTYKPGPEEPEFTDTGGGEYWNPHGAEWYGSKYGGRGWGNEDEPETRTPVWARAGWSGGVPPNASIHRNNYTDVNFIKKSIWELSGHSTHQYTIWGFDGHFFRNKVTVFGSPAVFTHMAVAMVDWQTKGANPYECRAVLVSSKEDPHTLWLVYADGRYLSDPIGLQHNSRNANPGNDESFTRRLPGFLDRLDQGAE